MGLVPLSPEEYEAEMKPAMYDESGQEVKGPIPEFKYDNYGTFCREHSIPLPPGLPPEEYEVDLKRIRRRLRRQEMSLLIVLAGGVLLALLSILVTSSRIGEFLGLIALNVFAAALGYLIGGWR
ncbi:MAG: hypothetical protein PHE83_19255 [Opitutaceae bacterium]|nr:hypothetical protein [Opitutaceae bacterium]